MRLRGGNLSVMNKCPICRNFFRKVAIIQRCCHRFCLDCIRKKIAEEGLHGCLVCKVDLGSAPLQELSTVQPLPLKSYRVCSSWQSSKKAIPGDECPSVQENTKISSQVSKAESSDKGTPMEEDDLTVDPISPTLSSNVKQRGKCLAVAEGSPSPTNVPEESDMQVAQMGITTAENDSQNVKTGVASIWTKRLLERVSEVLSDNTTTEVVAEERRKKVEAYWFTLVASDKQKTEAPLEQLPSRFLRVRNGNITISNIKKYLVQKLKLTSEDEVEIRMQGRQLLPTMQMWELLNLWVDKAAPSNSARRRAYVGCSAEKFVLTLTYGRKPEI